MKIILLGATGNTGIQLAMQATQRGHEVTALVRNPTKLATINDKNLKVIQCNLLDEEQLAKHFAGHDCVLSSLGSPGFTLFKITFTTDSIKLITSAMKKNNINRIIVVSSQYTKPNLPTYPTIYKVLLRPMIGRQLDDLYNMEQYLIENCSDLDYTIVRPPRLLDTPLNDQTVSVVEDKYLFEDGSTTVQMSRANVAKFMLDILESNKHLKKGVSIDMPKPTQQ